MRLSKQGVERIRNGLLRSWQPGGTHRSMQQDTIIDSDTVRARALFDRKGKHVGTFDIYHSTNRSDQLDLFVNGKLEVTGGPRVIANWIAAYK